jgi:hypothetical protein
MATAQARKPTTPTQPRVVGPPAVRREVKPIVQPKAVVNPRKTATPPPVYQSKQVRPVIQRAAAKYGRDIDEPMPDKLEFDESKDGTTCILIVWRANADQPVAPERTFSSGGGKHAEEKAIETLQEWVNGGWLKPQAHNPHYIAFFQVSKSPCSSESKPKTRDDGQPGCLERLQHLNDNGLKKFGWGAKVTFSVQIAATKPYYGKVAGGKAASKENYEDFGGGFGGAFGFVRT